MHVTGIANANGNEEADACVIQGNIIFIIKGGLRQVIKKFFFNSFFRISCPYPPFLRHMRIAE